MNVDYVLVPGAWMGGWIWKDVAARLQDGGHTVHQLTLSGLRPREVGVDVRLDTHVHDVLHYLEVNNLRNVVLVGHSYSGMVVGQVTDLARESVIHTLAP